jgi:integrase
MLYNELAPIPSDRPVPHADRLRLAIAAYLARFKGASRDHTHSDLRCYLTWCADRSLDPLAARRPHLELYIRWMQEVRRFKPSTVSRRFSVTAGFYRTCVIDGVLEHSPAEYVRRPSVPAESPTLGFTHLQFEALLTAARESANRNDFALVAMLGLLGLWIFEATGADIGDLGEEHGHRVLRVCGKGSKVVLVPLPPAVGRAIDRAAGAPARSCSTAVAHAWTGMRPPSGSGGSPRRRACGSRGHIPTCSGTHSSQPCLTPAWICATCRSPPATQTRAPPCVMTGPARTSTVIPATSWPRTWPPARDAACLMTCAGGARHDLAIA